MTNDMLSTRPLPPILRKTGLAPFGGYWVLRLAPEGGIVHMPRTKLSCPPGCGEPKEPQPPSPDSPIGTISGIRVPGARIRATRLPPYARYSAWLRAVVVGGSYRGTRVQGRQDAKLTILTRDIHSENHGGTGPRGSRTLWPYYGIPCSRTQVARTLRKAQLAGIHGGISHARTRRHPARTANPDFVQRVFVPGGRCSWIRLAMLTHRASSPWPEGRLCCG